MNACVDTIALINETTLGTFIYFASADVDFWHFLWSLDKWNGAIRWVSLNIFASQLPYQFEFFVVEYRVWYFAEMVSKCDKFTVYWASDRLE